VFAGDCTVIGAGTLLATLNSPFSSVTGKIAGTPISAVYPESGGTLDFLYKVQNGTNSPKLDLLEHFFEQLFRVLLFCKM
jgi:hypothetical protein